MLVSLITVSLNPGPLIKSAMESVLAQRHDNIEHIIVDGGSTDGSIELIKAYNGHIASFRLEGMQKFSGQREKCCSEGIAYDDQK